MPITTDKWRKWLSPEVDEARIAASQHVASMIENVHQRRLDSFGGRCEFANAVKAFVDTLTSTSLGRMAKLQGTPKGNPDAFTEQALVQAISTETAELVCWFADKQKFGSLMPVFLEMNDGVNLPLGEWLVQTVGWAKDRATKRIAREFEDFRDLAGDYAHNPKSPSKPASVEKSRSNELLSGNSARTGGKKKRATANMRMMETIQEDASAMGWSLAEWKKHLRCAKSTIHATAMYKTLESARSDAKAARMKDRRRKFKASDRRRD